MKILINPKNLIPDDSWQTFRKVRAVIENKDGCIAISSEAGKYIFPGGKCNKDEDNLSAIQREIREETGMILAADDFQEVLELETMYDNAIDYRTNMVRPRYTITTYYYVKTDQTININNMNLTEGEIKENFKICFVDRDTLFKMLSEEHKEAMNWQIFYEENQAVLDNILKK
ncbi:MAG: NUDIX hydrolase [Bacilli bacterium]|nr:NUDIX hydrolase [Bacilli bacterium]